VARINPSSIIRSQSYIVAAHEMRPRTAPGPERHPALPPNRHNPVCPHHSGQPSSALHIDPRSFHCGAKRNTRPQGRRAPIQCRFGGDQHTGSADVPRAARARACQYARGHRAGIARRRARRRLTARDRAVLVLVPSRPLA
jgi:hypothetical protein